MEEGLGHNIGILAHVIGILLLAGALAAQTAGGLLLRQAKTIDQVKLIAGFLRRLPLFFGIASGLILLSGIYLSWLRIGEGGTVGWLAVAIVVFLGMGAYGSLAGQRFDRQLGEAIAQSDGKITTDVQQQTHDSHQIDHAVLSGFMFLDILFLMIFQPGLISSIAITIGLIVVGLAISFARTHMAKPVAAKRHRRHAG